MIVRDIDVASASGVDGLVRQLHQAGGFTAKKLGVAADIIEEMVREEYTIFLTFPACIVATGTRGVIKDLVRKHIVHGIITTCGSLDHDLARTFRPYHHGSFEADDGELHREGVNRLGNIFVPNESYGEIIEKKMREFFTGVEGSFGTREIAWEIGKHLSEESFLYWAYKNEIPVYVPAITDGAVGLQLWLLSQEQHLEINLFKDERELSDTFFGEGKIGGIILGGGPSKHHLIWWAQFHGGLDAAVYITSAVEWDGSLSGARLREAISWGKVNEEASQVTVEGDATVIFPLLVASLIERIEKEARHE
ncbi:MAG: deoxyhypusine synthase [Thermoplasmata archaeon]|nr:MAG: deoxyhypusine synthase [Thermoplasmata archaeon]